MAVVVSLYNLKKGIFSKSCQNLISCISINPKCDLWTCQSTLALCDCFSSQLYLFKYRNMYVCVRARVCMCSVTLLAPDSVIQGKRISFGWMATVFPGRDSWDYSHNQSCETAAADPGPVVGQRWGENAGAYSSQIRAANLQPVALALDKPNQLQISRRGGALLLCNGKRR